MQARLEKYYFPLLLVLVAGMAFFKLGQHPIYEWDESHTVINAIEMLQTGDWINLHYLGAPDELRAKPPLFIWTVAASFDMFGVNKWSLRLPSALCSVLAFFFIFKIFNLYHTKTFAFYTCLILLPVKAIIGYHVGRTGDFDAMLLALLMGGVYYFLKWLRAIQQRRKHAAYQQYIYNAALLFGLAFLTKGPAMAVLFPGILLFLFITGQVNKIFLKKDLWLAGGISLIFPLTWMLIVQQYGVKIVDPQFAGEDSFQRMFVYDLLERFTNPKFENQEQATSITYFFQCLEESFKIWNYVFYGVLLGGLYKLFLKRQPPRDWQVENVTSTANVSPSIKKFTHSPANHLLILSICIWLSLGTFLSLVATAKWWYFAPAFPFIAYTTYYGIDWLQQRYGWVKSLFFALLILTMTRRYYVSLHTPSYKLAEMAKGYCPLLQDNDALAFVGDLPRQDVLGQLYLCNPKMSFTHLETNTLWEGIDTPQLLFIKKDVFYNPNSDFENYTIVNENKFYVVVKQQESSSKEAPPSYNKSLE